MIGPVTTPSSQNTIIKRPKHVWDIRVTPWTDGIGIQETKARAVEQCSIFHDSQPVNNSDNIPKNFRSIYLHVQLCVRDRDIFKVPTCTEISHDDTPKRICSLLYHRDTFWAAFDDLNDIFLLNNCDRSHGETFRSYEFPFVGLMDKLKSNGISMRLS